MQIIFNSTTLYPTILTKKSFSAIFVEKLAKNNKELADFVDECRKTAVDEETLNTMEKKGFKLDIEVEHPFDKNIKLSVYVANFILMDYGTGAIFACPAHDKRDFDFATKYNLPIKQVVAPVDGGDVELPYEEEGIATNSDFLNGLTTKEAKKLAIQKIKDLGIGEAKTNYRLRDWSFSRQRYWGCPIPVIYCPKCGTVLEDENNLPIKLPEDVVIDGKGNPLEKHPTWKHTK